MKNLVPFLICICLALLSNPALAQCDGDVIPPEITCGSAIAVNNDPGECSAFINLNSPEVFDACGILSLWNDYTGTEDASAVYPLGSTIVVWSSVDLNGNESTCTQNITVMDNELPIILNCPPDMVAPLSANCDFTLPDFFSVLNLAISDNCTIATTSQSPAAGTSVTEDTPILLNTTDIHGNQTTCIFMLYPTDMASPEILSCATDQVLYTNQSCEAALPDYTDQINAMDNCSSSLQITQLPSPGTIISQNTTIAIQVTDNLGNFANCEFDVTLEPELIEPQDIFYDMAVCLPDVEITAEALAPGMTGTWSISPANGVFEDPNDPTTTLTLASNGIYTVSWTIESEDNGCGISSWTGSFQVNYYTADPETPNAGPDQDICLNSDLFLEATDPIEPMGGEWTQISGAPAQFADSHDHATQVFVSSPGVYVFRWTLIGFICGEPPFDETSITVFDAPIPVADAGLDIELCSPVNSVQLQATSVQFPLMGMWSVIQGSGSFSNPNSPTTNVAGLSIGINLFLWTVPSQGCYETQSDVVQVIVYESNFTPAYAGPDMGICLPLNYVQLQATSPVLPAYGQWMPVGENICAALTAVNSPSSYALNLCEGINQFSWTVYSGPCAPTTSDTVTITVYPPAGEMANAGPDITMCPAASVQLQGEEASIGMWSQISGPTSAAFGDPNDPQSFITNFTLGEYVFRWTEFATPCNPESFDEMILTVNEGGGVMVDAGPDVTICAGSTVQLQATTDAEQPYTVSWSPASGLNNPTIPNPIASPPVTYAYTVTVADQFGCTSSDMVVVLVSPLPTVNAGPDLTVCAGEIVQLENFSPLGGTWSGTGVTPSGLFQSSGPGAYTLTYFFTNQNGCSDGDQLVITLNNPVNVNAGMDMNVCANQQVNLSGTPSGGVWSGAPFVSYDGQFDALVPGNYTLTYLINDGNGCSGIDQLTVTVLPLPVANAGSDFAVCADTPFELCGSGASNNGPITVYVWMGYDPNVACLNIQTSSEVNYVLTVADAAGCQDSDLVTVFLETNSGCMDPLAFNFDPNAICDSGQCSYIEGDLDGNGVITMEEFNEVLGAFGCVGAGCEAYDFNGDGVVGIDDLFILIGNM